MKESIMIVVAAIVILIIALVLLTIFGSGITGVTDFTQRRSICIQSGSSSCSISGNLPAGWSSIEYRVKEGEIVSDKTCEDLTGISSCKRY